MSLIRRLFEISLAGTIAATACASPNVAPTSTTAPNSVSKPASTSVIDSYFESKKTPQPQASPTSVKPAAPTPTPLQTFPLLPADIKHVSIYSGQKFNTSSGCTVAVTNDSYKIGPSRKGEGWLTINNVLRLTYFPNCYQSGKPLPGIWVRFHSVAMNPAAIGIPLISAPQVFNFDQPEIPYASVVKEFIVDLPERASPSWSYGEIGKTDLNSPLGQFVGPTYLSEYIDWFRETIAPALIQNTINTSFSYSSNDTDLKVSSVNVFSDNGMNIRAHLTSSSIQKNIDVSGSGLYYLGALSDAGEVIDYLRSGETYIMPFDMNRKSIPPFYDADAALKVSLNGFREYRQGQFTQNIKPMPRNARYLVVQLTFGGYGLLNGRTAFSGLATYPLLIDLNQIR